MGEYDRNPRSQLCKIISHSASKSSQLKGFVNNRPQIVTQTKLIDSNQKKYLPLNRVIANNEGRSRQLKCFVNNRGNVLQFLLMAGPYSQTQKSDAHHMPSARAIAAIIQAGIQIKNGADPEQDARNYVTLGTNDIYGGAPAVHMPHDDHVATRTYGGKSTNALEDDIGIITSNDSIDAKFDQIQTKDIEDCANSVNSPMTDAHFTTASTNTKTRIQSAITNNENVCIAKTKEHFKIADLKEKVIMIVDHIKRVINAEEGNQREVYIYEIAKKIGMDKSTFGQLLQSCLRNEDRGVSTATAYYINNYFDNYVST